MTSVDPETLITDVAQLPDEAFRIIEINELILKMAPAEANEAIQQLGSLDQSARMQVSHSTITDYGHVVLKHLPQLTNLVFLRVQGLSGRGLENLTETGLLTGLALSDSNLGGQGYQQLARFQKLKFLGLQKSGIHDDQLVNLSGLTNLSRL